jgi:flagellar basal body-associated protein FliL
MAEFVEPGNVSTPARAPRRRRGVRWIALILVAIVLAGAIMAAGAVYTNAFGAGDRFANLLDRIDLIIDPPPDRPTAPTILATPRPIARATTQPSPTPSPTPPSVAPIVPPVTPIATPSPTPSPTPTPEKKPVNVRVVKKPKSVFITQLTKEWCAPAGVQMVLASLGLANNSERFQHELVNKSGRWESRRDSLNGGWGPGAMVEALDAYGAKGYEIRAFKRRHDALLDAARAMSETGAPVILVAWRGAHTWVMTGYKATADPTKFEDARITGTYILDPWYPRVSTIWGASDPAGTFQDEAEMKRNFLPWKRPEGRYPDRDGRWLIVAPTIPASEMG